MSLSVYRIKCRYKKTNRNRLVFLGFLVHESSLIERVTS
nr:MAG TPA: hypothetical protein [Bacteriophage sp.]